MDTGDGWDDWSHGKALTKPADQLELTEAVRQGQGSSLLKFKTAKWAVLREMFQNLLMFLLDSIF